MNRKEFEKKLNHALKKIKRKEREELISHYNELISDLMENGMSEKNAIISQGSIESIAEEILENIEKEKLAEHDKYMRVLIAADIIFVIGSCLKIQSYQTSVSVIGGADGPTSIFVAGKIGSGSDFWYVGLGICLVITLLYVFWKYRRKK